MIEEFEKASKTELDSMRDQKVKARQQVEFIKDALKPLAQEKEKL